MFTNPKERSCYAKIESNDTVVTKRIVGREKFVIREKFVRRDKSLLSFLPHENKDIARLNSQINGLVSTPKGKMPYNCSSFFFFCPNCLVLDSLSRKKDFLICRACLGVWKLNENNIVEAVQNTVNIETAANTGKSATARNTEKEIEPMFHTMHQTTKTVALKSEVSLSDIFDWQLHFLASFIEKRVSQKKCIFYDEDINLRVNQAKQMHEENQNNYKIRHAISMLHTDVLYFHKGQMTEEAHSISDILQSAHTVVPIYQIQSIHILQSHKLLIQTLDDTQLYFNNKKRGSSLVKYFFAFLHLLQKQELYTI